MKGIFVPGPCPQVLRLQARQRQGHSKSVQNFVLNWFQLNWKRKKNSWKKEANSVVSAQYKVTAGQF